jgi:hypothetical protein
MAWHGMAWHGMAWPVHLLCPVLNSSGTLGIVAGRQIGRVLQRTSIRKGWQVQHCPCPALPLCPLAPGALPLWWADLTWKQSCAGDLNNRWPAFHMFRGPYDVMNLATLFGLTQQQAQHVISRNVEAAVRHAAARKAYKGVLTIQAS